MHIQEHQRIYDLRKSDAENIILTSLDIITNKSRQTKK